MPKPLAICIEDLDATSRPYLQCVAVAGADAGLIIDPGGEVQWQTSEPGACELWVSLDQRLILFRPPGAPGEPVLLRRGGRSLELPEGKPVVLLDQDRVDVGPRRLRVHVHGEAPAVHPPNLLPAQEPSSLGRAARTAAAALALGVAVGAAGCKTSVEVRDSPPKVAPTEPVKPKPDMKVPDTRPASPDTRPIKVPPEPIEVRVSPPKVAPPVEPSEDD